MENCKHCGGDNSQYCDHCEAEYMEMNSTTDNFQTIRDKIELLQADPAITDILEDLTQMMEDLYNG